MKIRKPRIFLGMISFSDYPNFQIYPFLNFADIISCCSPQSFDGRIDRISFDYGSEDFNDLLNKIPTGFTPDYFWDPQICGGSVPPYGLNESPFPTIAGLCHTFRGPHIEALANYYDFVAPISRSFTQKMENSEVSARALDIPVGGNWGSFNYTIWPDPNIKRDIDVLLNFSPSDYPEYGRYRKITHDLCIEFRKRFGHEFNVVIEYGVNKLQYLESMKRAKVVLNACGYNGPYNYRTFEAINCGALLMQIETAFDVPQRLSDYLDEGDHYIEFNQHNFEDKLLAILRNDAKRQCMNKRAFEKITLDLSYENTQKQLLIQIKQVSDDYKSHRKDEFGSFMSWMKILATSPVHYRHKRELFAKMAIDSGTDDPDSIRLTLMALPILANTKLGSSYINDIELKILFEKSPIEAITQVHRLLPGHELRLSDKWYYLCCQAMLGSANVLAIESLMAELDYNAPVITDKINTEDLVLFDLDLSDSAFVTLKKGALDMPYMTSLDKPKTNEVLLPQFLQESLLYFHRLAVIKLRKSSTGSNDQVFGYRKERRA